MNCVRPESLSVVFIIKRLAKNVKPCHTSTKLKRFFTSFFETAFAFHKAASSFEIALEFRIIVIVVDGDPRDESMTKDASGSRLPISALAQRRRLSLAQRPYWCFRDELSRMPPLVEFGEEVIEALAACFAGRRSAIDIRTFLNQSRQLAEQVCDIPIFEQWLAGLCPRR